VHGPRGEAGAASRSSEQVLTLLFVHGVTMDHRTFASQVEAFQERFRVVCVDLPGHGRSEAVDLRGPYSMRAARVLVELLDALQAHRAVLVGQSLGSTLCQRAATDCPERVVGSVHLGGVSLYPPFSRLLRLLNPFVALAIALFPRKRLYALFAAHKALRPHTRAYLQASASAAGKETILRLTLDMLRDMTQGIPRQLEHPMLICHGDHEAGFLKRLASRWHASQPGSSLAVIEDAHHIANQDNPRAFNEALMQFLDVIS